MTCDGSPGSPGVETIPGEDGPDKLACLGCSVCKPWNYAPFRNTVDIPPMMQGDELVEEAVRGLAWAREHPDAFKNEQGWVPCKQTAHGPGCGHNTLEHTGPNSPNQDCPCCTWTVPPMPDASRGDLSGTTLHEQFEAYRDSMTDVQAQVLESIEQLQNRIFGAMPNRAARRRAQGKGGGIAGGQRPNRRRYR